MTDPGGELSCEDAVRIVDELRAGADLSQGHLLTWRRLEGGREALGDPVEIYAHRLLPVGLGTSPLFPELPPEVVAAVAGGELTRLLRRFCAFYPGYEVGVELPSSPGQFPAIDLRHEEVGPFRHRIRVVILTRIASTPDSSAGSPGEPWWRGAWRRLRDGWHP